MSAHSNGVPEVLPMESPPLPLPRAADMLAHTAAANAVLRGQLDACRGTGRFARAIVAVASAAKYAAQVTLIVLLIVLVWRVDAVVRELMPPPAAGQEQEQHGGGITTRRTIYREPNPEPEPVPAAPIED